MIESKGSYIPVPLQVSPPRPPKKKEVEVYIVIGVKENVYQDTIGGPFTEHPDKEIVEIFLSEDDVKEFIASQELKKPKRVSYGDTLYYRGGYFDLYYEKHIAS
jgi:hypothetical protein